MKSFGTFLRYVRKQRELTQEQVAESLNIVTPVLSKWENDKAFPPLDLLCKLCNILNVSIEECINSELSDGERRLPPENYEPDKLGETIKDLRIKNGLSQAEVGKKLFVTSQTVSKWESGGISSLEILGKLAELFGLTPTELLNGLEHMQALPKKQATAEQLKKPNRFVLKITSIVLAVIIFLGAIAGLIVGLVLKYRTTSETTPPVITDPEEPQIDFCCPVKSFYNAEQSIYNSTTQQYRFPTLNFEVADGAEVYAAADGVVKSYGVVITIEHADGFISYYYSNFDEIQYVEEGSQVKKGQLIATCYNSLSFGLSLNDKRVLPLDYLSELPAPIERPQHVHKWGELKFDKYCHWHVCECGENSEAVEHTLIDNKCTECRYEFFTLPSDIDKTAYCLPTNSQIYRTYNQTYMNGDEPETHKGLDFSAEIGDKVYAIADGVIERISIHSYTHYCFIRINHGNGLKSSYLGVVPEDKLEEGTSIKKGQLIATVSEVPNPVEDDDGPHLHFYLTYNGVNVNPLDYIPYEEKQT